MHQQILPIGPYHPALKEPEYLKVWLEGEEIQQVELRLGFNYRGIEELACKRSWRKALQLIARTCGICGVAHSTNFCQAVEKLFGTKIPDRAKWIRCLFLELNRIQSHLLFLGVMAHVIGFETLFQWCWAIREQVMEWIEKASGNRIHYSLNCFGGVRRNVSSTLSKELDKRLGRLEKKLQEIEEIWTTSRLIKKRLRVGKLSTAKAKKLGVVGPCARGSGIKTDIRKDKPYQAYPELEFKLIVKKKGDSYARTLVRLRECFESIRMCRQIKSNLPKGKIAKITPASITCSGNESVYLEAPRGELLHYIEAGGKKPSFVRLRAPTYANIGAIRKMAVGEKLADFPPILESIDPCFGCCDRMSIVKDGKEQTISYQNLRKSNENN